MLKYILIVVLNLPFVFLGVARTISSYESKRISRGRAAFWMFFWLVITVGLFAAEPIYTWLQINNLTDSTPLSIFDVAEITGIIMSLTLILRLYTKTDILEQRLAQLNTEASIRLSEIETKH